jgi:hypothetical protein
LAKDYLIDTGTHKGKHLSTDTALNYLSSAMNQASSRFKATTVSDATRLFFTCLDPNSFTDEAQWLKRVKKEVIRWNFQRAMLAGEKMDHSAEPLFLEDVKAMCKSYAKEGSRQAARRKLAIKTLYQSAGRSSEIAFMHLDGMYFCRKFQCVIADVPQSKTSKSKKVALVAGNGRHACWFLDFGDYLWGDEERPPYEENGAVWLLRELRGVNSPGMHAH